MIETLIPRLIAAGLTPELARSACSVVADWIAVDREDIENAALRRPMALTLDIIVERLREAAGG